MSEIGKRADAILDRSRARLPALLSEMHAEHSSVGRLQSGLTVRRSVLIFEDTTLSALKEIEDQVAQRIQSRGRHWKMAFEEIGELLEAHVRSAPDLLRHSIEMGTRGGIALALPLLESTQVRLTEQLHEFRDGWTAPQAKTWRERHPFWYAVALLIMGALLSSVATQAGKVLFGSEKAVTK